MDYKWMWSELRSYLREAHAVEEDYSLSDILYDMDALEGIEETGLFPGKTGPERVLEATEKDRGGPAPTTAQGWA